MNPGFLEQISEYVSDIQIQEEHTLITLKKYRKALFYKGSTDLVLSELNTSAKKCYNVLTKKDFLREKLIVIDPLR